jgi:hypothetical protein
MYPRFDQLILTGYSLDTFINQSKPHSAISEASQSPKATAASAHRSSTGPQLYMYSLQATRLYNERSLTCNMLGAIIQWVFLNLISRPLIRLILHSDITC